jgi:hypothetical protein
MLGWSIKIAGAEASGEETSIYRKPASELEVCVGEDGQWEQLLYDAAAGRASER